MISNLYGISKVWMTEDIKSPYIMAENIRDGEEIFVDAEWEEICLTGPGSLSYEFSRENNANICTVTLTAKITDEISMDKFPLFYKAQTTSGEVLLIGLGNSYHTIPSSSMNDSVGSSSDDGNSTELKVTWKCICGRIYLK